MRHMQGGTEITLEQDHKQRTKLTKKIIAFPIRALNCLFCVLGEHYLTPSAGTKRLWTPC